MSQKWLPEPLLRDSLAFKSKPYCVFPVCLMEIFQPFFKNHAKADNNVDHQFRAKKIVFGFVYRFASNEDIG